jgi:heat shock protein HtpX
VTLQQQIRRNRLRSSIVVLGFVFLLLVLAGLVGLVLDVSLGVAALVFAAIYAVFAIVRARGLISGITHAQPVGHGELRPLRRLLENVSIGAGLPVTPELRIVEDDSPNAFAAGLRPTSSYVGVTTGLLRAMPKRELEAVLAHEVAHIRNRDTYLMTMATVFAGVIALLADIGFRTLAYGGRNRRAGALAAVLALVGFVPHRTPRFSCARASRGAASCSLTPALPRS